MIRVGDVFNRYDGHTMIIVGVEPGRYRVQTDKYPKPYWLNLEELKAVLANPQEVTQ